MKKATVSVAYRDDLRGVDFVWGNRKFEQITQKDTRHVNFTPKSRYIDDKAIKVQYQLKA
ncbi:hypothetical protein ACLGEJ_06675 [Helicobacter pylori]|uniref:hypothetical protein n=1 Tax=Helicobacter pylori TaxID=210 RepID=UPI000FDD3A91|nr:hypothetical protein [Helicobacter pylori]